MNIFYLDNDTEICAKYHCDKPVVKMILETAQMLSTAHRVIDGDMYADNNNLYKATHKNHPSAVWVRQSDQNYLWTLSLLLELMKQYTKRYNKKWNESKSDALVTGLTSLPTAITRGKFTTPPQCMPEDYKNKDTITAYKNYYIGDKARFAKWAYTDMPEWFSNGR